MMKIHQEQRGIKNLICYQGDSHCQDKMSDNKFDLIFGCNLIDRLHTPITWIKQSKVFANPNKIVFICFLLQEMLTETGILIISSPYTWKPEHTNVENWIGGYLKDAENHFTVDGLKEALLPNFVLLEEKKVPFVIPDADGTYQYTYSNCTIFGRLKN